MFAKLKFRLDFSGKLTLLLHLLVSAIRIFNSYFATYSIWQQFTVTVSNTLVWISLYYFVFELKIIEITLTIESPVDAFKAKHRIKTFKGIFFIISFAYIFILNGYYLSQYLYPGYYLDVLNPLFIGSRLSKLSMDFYVEYLFVVLLIFFIKKRRQHG